MIFFWKIHRMRQFRVHYYIIFLLPKILSINITFQWINVDQDEKENDNSMSSDYKLIKMNYHKKFKSRLCNNYKIIKKIREYVA